MPTILNQQGSSQNDTDYLMADHMLSDTSCSEEQDLEKICRLHQNKYLFMLKNKITLISTVESRDPSIELPTIDRPFEILFDSEQKKRMSLIEEIKGLPRPYAERLHRRIHLLNEAAEEEYPYEELLSAKSLEGFSKFMKRPEMFKYPDTSITPDGNIRVQWQQDKNHHLAIEFISGTEVKFVIFAPDPTYPVKVARISGKVSIDSVIIAIKPYNALSWSTE